MKQNREQDLKLNPIQDAREVGANPPPPPTSFFPITSRNVGISPKTFLKFSFWHIRVTFQSHTLC